MLDSTRLDSTLCGVRESVLPLSCGIVDKTLCLRSHSIPFLLFFIYLVSLSSFFFLFPPHVLQPQIFI